MKEPYECEKSPTGFHEFIKLVPNLTVTVSEMFSLQELQCKHCKKTYTIGR